MVNVLLNIGMLAIIGIAMAIPILLLARYTRTDEPLGNRHIGLFARGLKEGKDTQPHNNHD